MANELDCDIVVSKLQLLSCYYILFRINAVGKYVKPLIPLDIGKIVLLLFSSKESFGIR